MNPETTRLYWVRHGENWANITQEFSHRLVDYSLTPRGVLQAQQTAEFFRDKAIAAIYASPLRRAVETAEIIAAPLGLDVVVTENFREIDVGSLEGQPVSTENWTLYEQILADWLAGRSESAFPGGENYLTLWDRVRAGIEQIVAREAGRNVIVVAHGGIFIAILKDLCRDLDPDWIRGSVKHNCASTELLLRREAGRLVGELVAWASCAHLSGEAAPTP
ncbi:MAG TPA: histidine phosphatase family protein [Ardenticatenaceae bacterium]|nr:histidine phosphatase family protein [Ardenticatenaceae bacterium]